MGNIFVRRPIFAMVIAIMIVVLGLIAIRNMPIEQYPDITPPVVEVSAEYLGADALTIEQSVATPLEESVNGVSDMIYMQSTNSNNGSMSLQVSFAVGTDPDMNTIFTQNRVSSATSFRYTSDPSGSARRTIRSNCSTVLYWAGMRTV